MVDKTEYNRYILSLVKPSVLADFHCRNCGCLVYHPDNAEYDYNPESGLCRACWRVEENRQFSIIRQSEANTESYLSKRGKQ